MTLYHINAKIATLITVINKLNLIPITGGNSTTMETLRVAQTANANLQNKINVSVIFNYIREHGPTYRARISKDLNISAPAVSRIIEKLISDGYVIETSKIKTGSGKRPTQLMINSKKGIVIGIDLIKERTKIAVSDFSGKITYTTHGFKISERVDISKRTVEEINRVLKTYSEKFEISGRDSLKGIGIGIPATVDIKTGKILNSPLYENLMGINLKKDLEEKFNVPVYIENISKLSALGEKNYGRAKGYKNIVFIEISKGIGAGIIINNSLYRGTSGSAGEIGSMIVDINGLNFIPKNEKGYLEENASPDTLIERVKSALYKGEKSLILDLAKGNADTITPEIVLNAYKMGDGLAQRCIDKMVKLLSIAIINLILILNPEIVVIGGEICNLGEAKDILIKQTVEKAKNIIPFKLPEIEISKLGENAGVAGALFLAIESIIMKEFPFLLDSGLPT